MPDRNKGRRLSIFGCRFLGKALGRRGRRVIGRAASSGLLLLSVVAMQFAPVAQAVPTLYWDADGSTTASLTTPANNTSGAGLGGNGVWDTSTSLWWDGSSALDTVWANGDIAIFTGSSVTTGVSGGLVTLAAPISVDTIQFGTAGYLLQGGGSNVLTLTGSGAIQANAAGTDTISAVIGGSVGLNLSSTTTGTVFLNNSNTFSGGVTISSGTLSVISDAALGNASNSITFNGAGGSLSFATAVTSNRAITLSNSAAVTIAAGVNSAVTLNGLITGSGALTLTNTTNTFLTNAANNITGALWIQNGTAIVNNFTDAAGSGNLRLGNAATTGTFQWGARSTGPLTLTNRQIELAGTTGGGILDSSNLAQANVVTINSNLLVSGAGAKTLTLQGNNGGTQVFSGTLSGAVNTFAGTIGDSTGGATALTKTGVGVWVLTGNNTFTGITTLDRGVLRAVGSTALGGAGSFSFGLTGNFAGAVLELLSDTGYATNKNVTNNSTTSATIFIDRTLGGTGSGQTINWGTIKQLANTATISLVGNHGYNFTTGQNIVNGNVGVVLTNDLGAPGNGSTGTMTIAGITTDTTTGTATQTLSGWGDFVVGAMVTANPTLTPLNLTKSGIGVLTFNGSNAGWTSTTQGVLTLSAGTTRLTGASPIGSATITLGGGMLELRNDSNTILATNLSGVTGTSTLVLDHTIGGNGSNDLTTLGTLAANNTVTLHVVGDRGNALTLGTTTVTGAKTFTISNDLAAPGYVAAGYTPGIITFGTITSDTTAGTATLALAGFGDYSLAGNISSNTALLGINKSGTGLLTFSGNNAGWVANAANVLTLSAGTTRFTVANPIGAASVSMNGGLLALRNDAATPWGFNISATPATSTLLLDHSIGGSGANVTQTIGTIIGTATSTLNVAGDRGYALTTGVVTVNNTFTLTLANFLNAAGYSAAGYTPGVITVAGLTNASAGVGGLILSGMGDFTNFASNTIANTGGGTLNLTKSNLGLLTFSGTQSGWTTGTLNTTLGTTRILSATAAIGTATIGIAGGLTEIRSDTSSAMSANAVTFQTAGGTLVAAPLIGDNVTGKTVTLGTLTSLSGSTYSLDTNHNYGITFGGATAGNIATVLANVGNGVVTFTNGLTATAATATYTLNGNGDFNVPGNITNGTGTVAITKSGYGLLTLGGTNAINGAIILNGGVLRVTSAGGLGGATSTLALQGNSVGTVGLDLRSETGMDLSQHTLTNTWNTIINVDRAVGGVATNQTMILAGGAAAANNGWGDVVTGANGYSLQFGSAGNTTPFAEITGVAGWTFTNFIPNISGHGSIIFNSGLQIQGIAGSSGLTLGGTGDYLISGTLSAAGGGVGVNTLTKSGAGTLTLTADNSSATSLLGFNTLTTTSTPASVFTMSGGITRISSGNNLGGVNTTVNLNAAVLDVRSDTGAILAETITVGASNSFLNADRAIGGAGTGQLVTLAALKIGANSAFFTNGNNYSINTGTVTQTGASTLVNEMSGGTLTVPILTGTFNSAITGSGNTNITTALTLATGTLTKNGTGTLTISGNAGGANTNGAVTVTGGGLLALDYSTGAPANILQSTATLALTNGSLSVKGATTGTTTQMLGAVTLNSNGQSNITLNPNGGGGTTLTLGTLAAANNGSNMLVTQPANSSVTFNSDLSVVTAQGRNVVLFDGTSNYDWAANSGPGTATIAATYTPLITSGSNALNSILSNVASTTLTAGTTTNSLKIDTTTTGGALHLGAFNLALTQGGILFVGGNAFAIDGTGTTTGIKSGTASNSDVVVNNYGTGVLTISAPIITGIGTSIFTHGGTGTTIVGNTALGAIGGYTGSTINNGGTLQLVGGGSIVRLGATTSTNLTVNGGTFDVNGNSIGVANFNGGYIGTLDNTSATPVTVTIGNGNGTGTYLGTIKNSGGGALSLVKTGTGAVTLGDINGMSSLAFAGDLSVNSASTLTVAVPLADTAGTKINLGTATATDTPTLTYTGNTNFILNNRQFDLSGVSNATINANGVVGPNGTAAVMVINSNLLTDGTGTKLLTLSASGANVANGGSVTGLTGSTVGAGTVGSGQVAVVNQFNGIIGNPATSGTLNLTVAGAGSWVLGGANTFIGNVTLSSTGLVRATNSTSFGNAANVVNVTGTAVVDLRSDSNLTIANPFTMNGSFTINVDRAVGGSGYGNVVTIGALTEATTGKTLTVTNGAGPGGQLGTGNPVDGYGLRIQGLVLNGATGTTTITNNITAAGGSSWIATPAVGAALPGALVIDNISTGAGLGVQSLVINANGGNQSNGLVYIPGDITQGAGTTLGITQNIYGIVTLAGSAATNYSGGYTLNQANGTVRATTANSFGVGPLNASSGNVELRSDTNVTYTASAVNWNANAGIQLDVGEAINGNGTHGITFTLPTLNITVASAKVLTIGGIENGANLNTASNNNSGDSVAFNGVVFGAGNLSNQITNNLTLPGMLSLGNITGAASTTAALTIGGSGITIIGNVVDGAGGGTAGITYSGAATGVLDLSAATAANTYTGGFKITGGTARSTNLNSFGATTNVVSLGGGTLELRSDTSVTYTNPFSLVGSTTVTLGQLPGGTASTGGYGNTIKLSGGLNLGTTAVTMTVAGLDGTAATNGYNLEVSAVKVNSAAPVISNNMPQQSTLLLDSITSSGAGTNVVTISGSGVTRVTGDILNGTATAVGLTYTGTSGLGILDLGGATAATSAAGGYTGGLTISSGTARVSNGFALGPAANIVTLGTATLEIRSDTSVAYNNPLFVAGLGALVSVGQLPGGTGATGGYGNLITLGQATASQAGKTLAIAGIGGISGTNTSYSTDSEGYSVRIQGINIGGIGAGAVVNATLSLNNTLLLPATLTVDNVTDTGTIAGTNVLTFTGGGITSVTGDITDSATVGVKTGIVANVAGGFLNLAGTAATNYTGGLTLTAGTIRANSPFSLGASTNPITLNSGTLEIRSDTNVTYSNPLTNSGGANIFVGAAVNGAGGYGNTITLGAMANTVSGKNITVAGIGGTAENNGYTIAIPSIAQNVAATTITNNLNLPGVLSIGSVTGGGASANVLTIAGTGVTNITGDVMLGTATTLGLSYSGIGILSLNGTVATNYNSLSISGTGTVRINTLTSLPVAAGIISLSGNPSVLDFRLDTSSIIPNPITTSGNTVAINVDRSLAGANSNQTETFSGLLTFSTAGKGLNITGGNGYNTTFSGGVTMVGSETINNSSSGLLNFTGTGAAAITNSATSTLTFSGGGAIKVADVSQATALTPMTLVFSGTGMLDLSATNVTPPTTPYSGGFTLSGAGTVLASNPNNFGTGATMTLGGAGLLQWRNDNNASIPQAITVTASFTIDAGAATTATGKTLTLNSISIPTNAATTITLTGRDNYSYVLGSLALPGTSGQTTTLVANLPLTITGNVTNNEVGFAAGNFDTLVLDGLSGGTINGTLSDAVGGSKTLGGYTPLTKQGTGTWTLLGANSTNTGPTSVTAGTLILSAAGAINTTNTVTVNGATAVLTNTVNGAIAGAGTSVTLTAGTLLFPNSNSYTGNTTLTAGNASIGNVGSFGAGTILFNGGTLLASADLGAGVPNVVTLGGTGTIGGSNNLNLSGSFTNSGGNRTLTVNNTALTTLSGPVYLSEAIATARAFTINGSGPVTVSGAIADANGVGLPGTFNYSGTSTLTLSGASTYTGPSNFSGTGSTVKLTGSLANTAVSVTGGTFAPGAGSSIGNTATAAAGATLNMGAGRALNLADGIVGNFTILGGSTFVTTNTFLTLNSNALSFDLDNNAQTADELLVGATGNNKGVATGVNTVTLNILNPLKAGSYTLISATDPGSTLNGGNYTLTNPNNVTVGGTTFTLQLLSSPTLLQLVIAAGSGNLPAAYWASSPSNGSANTSSWSDGAGVATNFSSDSAGTTISTFLPDLNSNVFFTATTASHLSTTLDNNFTINSLNFTGTGTSNAAPTGGTTIAPGTGGSGAANTLTINAAALNGNSPGVGITVQTGSGANTISAPVALGANQTWLINDSSLTVSSVISEVTAGTSLTKAGAGILTLSGNNTFTGGTTLGGGLLNINAQGIGPGNSAIGTGAFTLTSGTFDVPAGPLNLTSTTNNPQVWSNGGSVAFIGTNAMNLGTGAVALGADATAATFTLTNNSALAGTSLTIGGNITSGVGGTAGAKTVVIGGPGGTALTGNITVGTATGVTLTDTSSGTLKLTGTSAITILNVNGGAASIVDLGSTGSVSFSNAGLSFIQSSAGGTINGTGSAKIVLNSNGGGANFGDNGTANGTVLTINVPITGQNGFEIFSQSTANTGVTVLTAANTFTGDVAINGGILSVANVGNAGSVTSNMGAGTNIFISNGNGTADMLRYTGGGAGETTNRVIQLNGSGGIDQEGASGLLKFTADVAAPGANTKTLFLTGSTAGSGELAGNIKDNSGTNKTNVTKSGTDTWTLSGPNTYSGLTTVTGGTLILKGSASATSGVTISGGTNTTVIINTVTASGVGNLTSGSGSTTPIWDLHIDGAGSNGTITVPNTYFQNSAISATIDVNNVAAVAASGNQNNVVQLGAAAAPTWGGLDTLNVTGGNGYSLSIAAMTTNQAVNPNTLNPTSAALILAGYSGTVAGNHTLNLDGTNTGNQASNLNPGTLTTLNITKTNTSTWALVTANLYNGITTINGGVLSTGATGTLANGGTASSIGLASNAASNLVINGGTLRYANTGAAESTDRLFTVGITGATLDASGANTITFAGNGIGAANAIALAGSNTARTLTLTGTGAGILAPMINDNGTGATAVAKTGGGIWTLTNTNGYSGSTQVFAGTLGIASDAALGAAGTTVTLSAGALLATNTIPNFNHKVALAAGTTTNGLSAAAGKTLTINSTNLTGDGTTGMTIGSAVNTGMLVLTGTNNAFQAAVNITGGTLGGNATIGSAVTLTSGTITAGNTAALDQASADSAGGVATLHIASLALKGGTYAWKVTTSGQFAPAPTAGVGYDKIAANTIDLTGLNGTTAKTTLAIGNQFSLESAADAQHTPNVAEYFQIATGSVTTSAGPVTSQTDVSGLFTFPTTLNGSYAIFAEPTSNGVTLLDGTAAQAGLVLSYTPVPEPVVTGLLGLAAMALARRPRRNDRERSTV